MEEKIPADAPICHLPGISPEEVHKNIMRCYKLGNRLDRKKLGWIFYMIENKFWSALGSPRPVCYVMVNLQYEKSEAYEVVNAAKVLPFIRRSADAFEEGVISWAKLKQIARVATEETDEAWLNFAKNHKPGELKAEVRDALKANRKNPRKADRGLSNITVKQTFHLNLEDQQIMRKALEKVAAVMRAAQAEDEDDAKRSSPEEVLLFLSRRVLETEIAGPLGDLSEQERAAFMIHYQACPGCKKSHIHTEDGAVEVPHDHVTAVEGKARKVEITEEELLKGEAIPVGEINDQAVPQGVKLKVLARYAHSCACCGSRLHLHIHHIIFRSNGGPNAVWNLVSVCQSCHSLIHGGTLEVYMDSLGALHWKSKADRIERILGDELKEFVSIPSVNFVIQAAVTAASPVSAVSSIAAAVNGANEAAPVRIERPEMPERLSREAEQVVRAIMKITDDTKEEARARVWKAIQMLLVLGTEPSGDDIFATAFYGELVVHGKFLRRCGNSGPEAGTDGKNPPKAPETGPENPETPKTGDSE